MAEELRIAYFIDRLLPGGTELQLLEQINRFHKHGVRQVLFCLYRSEEHDRLEVACEVRILNVRSLARVATLRKLRRTATFLRKNRYTVVQAFFFDSIFFGVLAGRLGGVKTVLSSRRDMGFWYRPFLLTVLRGLNLLTTRIVANSEAVRGVVLCRERVSRGKIDIMANGIDLASLDFAPPARRLARASLGLSSGQIAIGLIANMSRAVKRVDLLVRAAGRVARSHGAKLRFFVLGEGHLKEGLIELTRSLGLAETVRFLTWPITRERLLPALDIGALTSDSEGFSNAVLEYLAAGLPVVVSDVGGNRELVVDGSNGFLFPPGDADALAEKIQSLSTDDTLRLSLAASARDSVRGYDWGARIPHMLRYYRSFDGVRT